MTVMELTKEEQVFLRQSKLWVMHGMTVNEKQ